MDRKIIFYSCLTAIVIVSFTCRKEYSCEGCQNNLPPVAKAGPDQIINLPVNSIFLDGRGSVDPDGRIASYLWSKISGPPGFSFINATVDTLTIKNLVAGNYMFELSVTDNGGLSTRDTTVVKVNLPGGQLIHLPPVANAGADTLIKFPLNFAFLNGNGSFDPDQDISFYQWSKISGPSSFTILNPTSVQTALVSLEQGVYEFQLKVADSSNLFDLDTVKITVVNFVELLFQDLVWNLWFDVDAPGLFDEIFLVVQDTANIIPNSPAPDFEVWVQEDSVSNWEPANPLQSANCTPPYSYKVYAGYVVIFSCPGNYSLVGKRANVRIRYY